MIFLNSKGQPIYDGRQLLDCDHCPCCTFKPIYSSPFLMGLNGSDLIQGAEINSMMVNGIELRMTWNSEDLGVKPNSNQWVSKSVFTRYFGNRLISAALVVQHDLDIYDPDGLGSTTDNYRYLYYNSYNLFIEEYDENGALIRPGDEYNYSARYQFISVTDQIASGNVIRGSSKFPGLSLSIPAGNSTFEKYDFEEMIESWKFEVDPPDFLVFDPGYDTGTEGYKRNVHCYYTPAYISAGSYEVSFFKNETDLIGIYEQPEESSSIECPDDTVILGPVTGKLFPITTTFVISEELKPSSGSFSRSGSVDSPTQTEGKCVYEILYECSYDEINQIFKWELIEYELIGWFEGSSAEEQGYIDGTQEIVDKQLIYTRVEESLSEYCSIQQFPELEPCSPTDCGETFNINFDHLDCFTMLQGQTKTGEYLYIHEITPPIYYDNEMKYKRAYVFCIDLDTIVAEDLHAGSAIFLKYGYVYRITYEFDENTEYYESADIAGTISFSICLATASEITEMISEMGDN